MSSQNNESSAAIVIFSFIGVAVAAAGIAIAIGFAFLCFVFSVLALFALHQPLRIGKIYITPDEARAFLSRGLIGAILTPLFALFCAIVFKEPQIVGFIGYIALGGYMLGSLGIEILMSDEDPGVSPPYQPTQVILPPQVTGRALPPALPSAVPPAQREPFRYASWDDEEAGRS